MKYIVYFLSGIVMIAAAIPAELPIALSETLKNHYCEVTPPNTPQFPLSVYCDRENGRCNENSFVYFFSTEKCVDGGDEYQGNCTPRKGPSFQQYTIVFVDKGLLAVELGLNLGGAVVCTAASVAVGAFGTPAAGFVTSVVCGGVVYGVNKLINPCSFGTCKVDWTIPSKAGPLHTRCN